MRQSTNHPDEELTRDDLDMLQQVLMNVRGSYPDAPYRQADFVEEDFDLEV
ncbi:MAG TPA: hypothetical protein VL362_00220 [Patescibacteria group bacterium]|jgi:hypothetical protein|nr:hypothetical protein [Patescibacteria group bacterium]